MITPFTIEDVAADNSVVNISASPFSNKKTDISVPVVEDVEVVDKEKKTRKRKSEDILFSNPSHMDVVAVEGPKKELSMIESNDSYESKYVETNNILRSAIAQIDISMSEINNDIQSIRGSRTLKRKYDYLAALEGTMGNFLSNKISAARELNNTINRCNELEIKRYKEIKASSLNDQDEDRKVMEMYQAFINTPVSAGTPSLGPSMFSMTANQSGLGVVPVGNIDNAYAEYHMNMTPQQNMMHLESNPDIKQVVVYNQETGARSFEIMNMATGEIVPNAEKHDAMFLEGVTIDTQHQIARSIDLGETYPLVVVGQPLMNEY